MIAAALNATRERRSSMSAVEDINRTLAELESQIAILEGETGQPLKETTQRKYSESAIAGLEAIAEQLRRLSDPLLVSAPKAQTDTDGPVSARLSQMRANTRQPDPGSNDTTKLHTIDMQLKRIDTHLAAAPGQEDPSAHASSDAMFQRLGELSRRIDMLHTNAAIHGQTINRLTDQLETLASYVGRIAEKLDATELDKIEQRLAVFANKLETIEKRAANRQAMFQDAIEQRFHALTERLDAHYAAHQSACEKVEKLETGLVDNPAIRKLELQIAALGDMLAKPSAETAALEHKIASIEKTITDNRDVVIEAARLAAEQAVKHFAEQADHKNAQTFASIQSNLTAISERLAKLEDAASVIPQAAKPEPLSGIPYFRVPNAKAATARHSGKTAETLLKASKAFHEFRAEQTKASEKDAQAGQNHYDNIAPFPPRRGQAETEPAQSSSDNGQAGPDGILNLNAIMKRLRGERAHPVRTAIRKPDLIQVARMEAQRKAKAPATESTSAPENATEKNRSIRDIVSRNSRPLLFTVTLIAAALSAIQLGIQDMANRNAPEIDGETTASIPDEPAVMPKALAPIPQLPDEAGPLPLRRAAAKGDVRALSEIGNRYFDGRNGKVDYETAAQWYTIAALRGFAPAQFRLGKLYDKGLLGKQDARKAEDWYLLAAKAGNVNAMHHLAVLYSNGIHGEADNAKAISWFREAAQYGLKDSQYNLGVLAARGLGMPADFQESYKWFALAARSGDKEAAEKRDMIAQALSPEQRAAIDQSIQNWTPTPRSKSANLTEIPAAWSDHPSVATPDASHNKS
ncbi:hypothetical protein ACFO1V_13935 [Daeguia caeni]|uniref:Sel1 repeat family protein n=1 Tax=Daeguia caeni TaxID=439612 RepID=A0ABV9H8R1_9HYPH